MIGQGRTLTVIAREVMLTLLIVRGPMSAEDLDRNMVEIPGQERGTPGSLAQPVLDERVSMRHRLWALDCHHLARPLGAPFALTPQGTAAAKAALRAHALRPHQTLAWADSKGCCDIRWPVHIRTWHCMTVSEKVNARRVVRAAS
ncbi:hypothetical protein ABZU75_21015 [Streptosporangium sp. NPDC005286]|uniref:hypothetical protein n=1 Tax=Streptosporangium sp. NPDC005286 TaxID=3154463 RepID=UPI0033BBF58D